MATIGTTGLGSSSSSRRRSRPPSPTSPSLGTTISSNCGGKADESTGRWWTTLPDECPITLEPLSTLPYPPFCLYSPGSCASSSSSAAGAADSTSSGMYFDGLALASYMVSRATFQNPLTREALTWEDCVRLDDYLDVYCYGDGDGGGAGGRGRISVREAYGLREKVRVGGGGLAAAQQNDASHRRAEALRSEAAAALRGLFVYGNDRRRQGRGNGTTAASSSSALFSNAVVVGSTDAQWQGERVPPAGFALHRPRNGNDINVGNVDDRSNTNQREGYDANGEVVLSEVEGLKIIDDDAAIARGSDDAAWREVQEAFPRLDGSNDDDYDAGGTLADNPGQSELLQRAREVAEQTRRKEEERRLMEERSWEILIEEAMKRRMERAKRREEDKIKQAVEREAKIAEDEEIARAQAEIEQWREEQWRMLADMAEETRRKEYTEEKKQAVAVGKNAGINGSASSCTTRSTQPDVPSEQDAAAKAAAEEERRAAKKAAKRKKERERQKAKKAAERKERERLAKLEEEKKKRDEAKIKCAHCGRGILDGGFDKFGSTFCSTKCARAGAAP
mmetsp:Transcript_20573/g.44949  ORF Transcript_20573/g.44949 Transcript_20573/m.44949 type:complete len:564 (+) Transcript_20573:127-1818(+)